MIRLRLSTPDLTRLRFAYSPLTELGESLYLLHGGSGDIRHWGWRKLVAGRLRSADTELLRAVVPARGYIADFFLSASVTRQGATIEQQLDALAKVPRTLLRSQLEQVWAGSGLPAAARALVADDYGAERLAAGLLRYWQEAIEPYWPRIRAVLDADVAYRTSRLASGGIEALLSDLHPDVRLGQPDTVEVVKSFAAEHDLGGAGLLLIPCAFAWPGIIVDAGGAGSPGIVYGPRGVGTLWHCAEADGDVEGALPALLGRRRAAVLGGLALARCTTDLARALGQSPSAVSVHLAVLRRAGLVTSWRSGRRVLYQRTALGSSIVAASQPDAAEGERQATGLP